jgi:multidrug transporter EmrE-like cation transporter
MTTYLPLILLFAGGVILTAGDIVMKKWVSNHNALFFMIGLAIYLCGLVFLVHSYKYKNIAVASTMFVIFNVVTLSFVSWFYFKEGLSVLQMIGIIMGLGAVVVLELA